MYFQIVNQNKLKFNFSGFILKKKIQNFDFFCQAEFSFQDFENVFKLSVVTILKVY
jgi:hypothetical protein